MPPMEAPAQGTPPVSPPQKLGSRRKMHLSRIVWIAIAVAIVIVALGYLIAPRFFPHTAKLNTTGSYILSLDTPVKDTQGIPYTGMVLYTPATQTYSYIATENMGTALPLGADAFSPGIYYLALRNNASSTDLVLYNRTTLAPMRAVATLGAKAVVAGVAWSPNGAAFAYLVADGSKTPSLKIESVSGANHKELGFDYPIGFSPNGAKVLVRGTPAPSIINVANGERTKTTGAAFPSAQTKLMLSTSGTYLVAVTGSNIDWYTVDWNTGAFAPAAHMVAHAPIADVVFGPFDALLVREEGADIGSLYTVKSGSVPSGFATLNVPDGAHILHIVSL